MVYSLHDAHDRRQEFESVRKRTVVVMCREKQSFYGAVAIVRDDIGNPVAC